MTEKKDRVTLLENFAVAAGELTESALNELNEEKRVLVAQALASGGAHIRILTVLSPLIIIGSLHSTVDRSIPPSVLFRIEGDGLPTDGDFH